MHATKYLVSLILAVLMFMHQSQCKPAIDEDPNLKQLNELLLSISKDLDRDKLLGFTMAIVFTMGAIPKQFVWENIEEILKDPAIVNVKTDKMAEYKSKLNQTVQDYKNAAPGTTIPLHEFKYYLESIGLRVNAKEISGEEAVVVNELTKRIIEPMADKEVENYNKTMDLLVKAVEQYLNKLSEEQRKQEDEMEQWLRQFKKVNDIESKALLFSAFIGFFK